MNITYNTRILPFLRAEVVEIEIFVGIKKYLWWNWNFGAKNPTKKVTAAYYFSLTVIVKYNQSVLYNILIDKEMANL